MLFKMEEEEKEGEMMVFRLGCWPAAEVTVAMVAAEMTEVVMGMTEMEELFKSSFLLPREALVTIDIQKL